jgi:L-asparagine oxygenase
MQAAGTTVPGIDEVVVPSEERPRLRGVLTDLVTHYGRADDPGYLREVCGLGHLLPASVRDRLSDMRYLESAAALVVRGGPVTDDPGPTPAHWRDRPSRPVVAYDFWLTLLIGQLGEPMSWWNIQEGELLSDLLPQRENENEQNNHGSAVELEFHVEEAFHDHRAQAFGLVCLRNEDSVPTTVAPVNTLDLDALDLDTLFEPRFRIGDDEEYRVRPVLFGAKDSPYSRPLDGDDVAGTALDLLHKQLGDGLVDVVLDRGDVVLVDNYRAVHGRRSFQARYDGTDRWMRRTSVVRDLRRFREWRSSVDDRMVTKGP